MDFLDPKKRRANTIKLFIGYALMTLLLVMSTVILIYAANGYGVDTKTGQIIQNGLLFVDAHPEQSTVYINGEEKGQTDQRLVLPEGNYKIRLERPGYVSWEKDIVLNGGAIQRHSYPILLPNKMVTSDVQTYTSAPTFSTNSPDRRWVLVMRSDPVRTIDRYDFSVEQPVAQSFTLPATSVTATDKPVSFSVADWSNDNTHVLLQRTGEGINEFILLDITKPETAMNINQTLAINPRSMTLRDKSSTSAYMIEQGTGMLRRLDLEAKTVSAPLASNVMAYKSHGTDIVMYAALKADDSTKTEIHIATKDKNYLLHSTKTAPNASYQLDVSRYDGNWYYMFVDDAAEKAFLYKNPVEKLNASKSKTINPEQNYHAAKLQLLGFSANTQYIALRSGQQFFVYDAEYNQRHRFALAQPLSEETKVSWMDGNRLLFRSDSNLKYVEFDGANVRDLGPIIGQHLPLFDRDYTRFVSIQPNTTNSFVLRQSGLIIK